MEHVELTIDIAGFYYSSTISTSPTSTLRDAMQAAVAADAAAGPPRPTLSFSTEIINGQEFIDSIAVRHHVEATSRQDATRKYPAGLYEYFDDPVDFLPNGSLVPLNPNTPFVLAWQYYCYDAHGRDLARAGAATDRKVEPFTQKLVGDTRLLVWRLVTIFLRPSYSDSLKIARAKLRSGMA